MKAFNVFYLRQIISIPRGLSERLQCNILPTRKSSSSETLAAAKIAIHVVSTFVQPLVDHLG